VAIVHDGVVATLHIFYHCCGLVPFGQVGTSATGVIAIESKAMCPAVIHVEAIVGYDRTCSCRDIGECSGHWRGMRHLLVIGQSLNVCCIGAMKSCLACGELVQAFFVFGGEVLPKLNKCLLCNRVDLPSVTHGGEDAGCFKHEEGKVFDGNVGQGIASDGDALDFLEALASAEF